MCQNWNWSNCQVPFDEGALTGKYTLQTKFPEGDVRNYYFRGNNLRAVVQRVEEIKKFLEKTHPKMSMAEYALRFTLSHPAVHTVIPGIRNTTQADQNSKCSDGQLLSAQELKELQKFYWRKDFWHEEVKE